MQSKEQPSVDSEQDSKTESVNATHQGNRSEKDIILNTVVVGSSYLLLGYLVSLIIGLVTRVLVSRWLGELIFGQFSIIISLMTTIYIFAMFALDTGLLRYIPSQVGKNPEKVTRTIYSILGLILATSSIFALTLFLFRETLAALLLQSSILGTAIIVGALLVPSLALFTLIYSTFQAFQDMRTVMHVTILQSVTLLPLTIAFLYIGLGLYGAIYAILCANIIAVVAGFIILRRTLLVPTQNKRPTIPLRLARLGLMVYVLNIFGVVSAQSGTLLLGYFNLTVSAGIFAICWMFGEIAFNTVGQVAYRSFFPLVSELAESKSPQTERIFNRVMRYTILAALVLYLPLLLLPEILLPLFGPGFIQGNLAWRILALGFFFRTLSQPPETFLVIEERRRFEIGLHGSSCVLLILLIVFLIPIFGLTGVAISAFCWQFTIFAGIWIYFRKTHKFHFTFLSPRLDEVDREVLKGLFKKLIGKSN